MVVRKRQVSGGAVKKPPRKKKKPPPKWIFVDCWMNGSIWQNEWIIMQCFCDLELDGMFMKLDVFKVEIPWRLKSKNPPRKTFMSWLGLWTTTVIKSLKSGIFNVHFGNNQFSKRASGLSLQFPTVNTEPWVALINIVLTVHSRDKIDIYQKGTFFYLRRRRKFLGIGGLSFARRRRKKIDDFEPWNAIS